MYIKNGILSGAKRHKIIDCLDRYEKPTHYLVYCNKIKQMIKSFKELANDIK